MIVEPNSSADNMAPTVSKGACIRIASRGSALTASSKARVPGRTFIANSHCQLRGVKDRTAQYRADSGARGNEQGMEPQNAAK